MSNDFENRKLKLKEIRNKFLSFHKILLDWDRENYEREFGVITAGKFLEMLLGDKRFNWLRTISTLIVKIDEAYDLDDGLSVEMVEGFYTESRNLFDDSDEYMEFKNRLEEALPFNSKAAELKSEIETLLK